MLFDCNVRSWSVTDTSKIQSIVDKASRFVWNNGKGQTLMRMQYESVNIYEIRRQLGIVSVRTKIEMRALYRLGHVLRMPNDRCTKKIVLGRWCEDRKLRGV